MITSVFIFVLAVLVRASIRHGRSSPATAAELGVTHLESVMSQMSGRSGRPYIPLVATLTVFIAAANLLGLLPALRAPTADFSTAAALAFVVFIAVPFYGIRARGLRAYLRHYLEPSPLLLPLEIIAELSRTITLAIRLFGNMMSEELIIGVLLLIAGFLIPVPIMVLDVLISVVQAYIFAILAMVYISAVVRSQEPS
jgi:F-type H+-transporting ATPase subunit a